MKRKSIGQPEIDELIGGGLLCDTINLVCGSSGTGKTTLAGHYIKDGLQKNEPTAMICLEHDSPTVKKDLAQLGCVDTSGLQIFVMSAQDIYKNIQGGWGLFPDAVYEQKFERLVIDPLTPVLLSFENIQKRREIASALFTKALEASQTCLLTCEPDQYSCMHGIESLADSILNLTNTWGQNQMIRQLKVQKMRWSAHSPKIHQIEITENGISIQK